MQGLSLSAGGSEYAIPFNQSVPFFKSGNTTKPGKKPGSPGLTLWKKYQPDDSSHFPNILALEDKKFLKYHKCDKHGGCGLIHEPNDTCPLWICAICGKEKKENDCAPGSCKTKCSHCGKTGVHYDEDCPLFCKKCEINHEGKPCPKVCKKCKKEPCKCPCKVCGEAANPCTGCCKSCNKKKKDCICSQGDSKSESVGPKETLILFKKNKSDNIFKIKEAMQNLGISIEDLK